MTKKIFADLRYGDRINVVFNQTGDEIKGWFVSKEKNPNARRLSIARDTSGWVATLKQEGTFRTIRFPSKSCRGGTLLYLPYAPSLNETLMEMQKYTIRFKTNKSLTEYYKNTMKSVPTDDVVVKNFRQ